MPNDFDTNERASLERDEQRDAATGSPASGGPPPSDGPEPPPRWNPAQLPSNPVSSPPGTTQPPETRTGVVGSVRIQLSSTDLVEFGKARRLISASYIVALVSIFIGGAFLSTAALVCAIIAYRKLTGLSAARSGDEVARRALARSGIVAIVMSAAALVLNVIAVFFLYPVIMESLQTGGFSSLAGGSIGTGSGNSTWG